MSRAELPPISHRSLRTAAIRRAVLAPEIERYLARSQVDLLVTDQIEAIQVRVEKGIEVLDRHVREGLRLARRRIFFLGLTAAVGFTLPPVHVAASAQGVFHSGGLTSVLLWTLALLVFLLAVKAMILLARVLDDRTQLLGLANRYSGGIERAKTVEELLAFAEQALSEALGIGMVPSEGGG